MTQRAVNVPPMTPKMAAYAADLIQRAEVKGEECPDVFVVLLALQDIAGGQVVCQEAEKADESSPMEGTTQ